MDKSTQTKSNTQVKYVSLADAEVMLGQSSEQRGLSGSVAETPNTTPNARRSATNASQESGAAPPAPPPPSSSQQVPTATPSQQQEGKKKKKTEEVEVEEEDEGEVSGCSLDEFWNEACHDWGNVQPTKAERTGLGRRKGLACCKTAPDCFTCGAKLNAGMLSGVPCMVCGCFN
ncbi:uncharacterized protein GGS25DRAFT_510384 [Hypoxylon fragiforme]|uniref:uncharacterized protein n=1 Tax=Hypoxylon fragiforme TaxID=63214 RepID=UPI0020C6D75F|nr:uncharacterized protein GGS25DRAFT_510384 [Hypoxylon fragiforme]KAI2603199.1 hypothetical protein GGS25DRAFT_510384 [Hypoxylon fragiforme]